jgi:sulfide:quinone oxidoreductase
MKKLSQTLSVAPQIQPQEVARLAEAGFKSLICNRPDGEESGQPAFATIAAAADAVGMKAVHLPVVSGAITPEQVRAFADLIARLPDPIFAYCRSGARCEMLWTQGQGLPT